MASEKRAPVQGFSAGIPWSMHLRAYDAYCLKYGAQQALIEGGCRGGFGVRELDMFIPGWRDELSELENLRREVGELERELAATRAQLNTPSIADFAAGVVLEAAHQRERYGFVHDAGKEPQDWFWLLGYLAGKALRAALDGDRDKALHHTISTAAALANWHAALMGVDNRMRPGIAPPNGGGS